MEVNTILKALEHQGRPLIRHIKTGGSYYLRDIIKVKVAGGWHLGATYYNSRELFCRGLEDFEGFEYLCNEIENEA